MLTSEAVIAEACHLLRAVAGGGRAVVEMAARGMLQIPFRLDRNAQTVVTLMERYADVPISLADASLVCAPGFL